MKNLLGTNALVRSLLYVRIDRHHVVHIVQFKTVTSKEKESIDILADQRRKVLQCLQRGGGREREREREDWRGEGGGWGREWREDTEREREREDTSIIREKVGGGIKCL